ncbi:hypothetical protein V6N13_109502 [Hibiscus sabdariffa]|uniref:Uncharacterized protein n=1 Tax=Hibiscus sabdariffa TaxID=183260 RepID=A0ABR2FQA9_9ROSI
MTSEMYKKMMKEMYKQMILEMTEILKHMISEMSKQIMSELLKHVSSEVSGPKNVVSTGKEKEIKHEEKMDNMSGISTIEDKIFEDNFVTLCKDVLH